MKEYKRIKNLLNSLLGDKMTQKQIAKKLGVTEATLSDFTNLKRSTINIGLLNDILNCKDLNIDSVSDLFSIVESFSLEKYEETKYYPVPAEEYCFFSFSNNPNNSYVEVLEALNDGRVLVTRFNPGVERFTVDAIHNQFIELGLQESKIALDEEDTFVHELTSVAKRAGIIKEVMKYIDRAEALQTIEMLYL